MHRFDSSPGRLDEVARLIDLRDSLIAAERAWAGRANAAGMAMRVPEAKARHAEIAAWVQAGIGAPSDLLMKSLTTALEHFRKKPDVSPVLARLAETTEELAFWGKMLQTLAKGAIALTPAGLALAVGSAGASWAIKARRLHAMQESERLHAAMERFWQVAMDFRRQVPGVVAELNREITRLRT